MQGKRFYLYSVNKVKLQELVCDRKCWNAHSHIITIQKICQLGNTNIASLTRYDVTRSTITRLLLVGSLKCGRACVWSTFDYIDDHDVLL